MSRTYRVTISAFSGRYVSETYDVGANTRATARRVALARFWRDHAGASAVQVVGRPTFVPEVQP